MRTRKAKQGIHCHQEGSAILRTAGLSPRAVGSDGISTLSLCLAAGRNRRHLGNASTAHKKTPVSPAMPPAQTQNTALYQLLWGKKLTLPQTSSCPEVSPVVLRDLLMWSSHLRLNILLLWKVFTASSSSAQWKHGRKVKQVNHKDKERGGRKLDYVILLGK